MTAREHDPALVETGWIAVTRVRDQHPRDPRDADSYDVVIALLDAVTDDIARAERERVLDTLMERLHLAPGRVSSYAIRTEIRRLREGEGS